MINSIHLPSPFSILCHLSLIPKIPCLSIALYGLLCRTQLNLFDLFSIPKQLLLQLFYLINDCITMLINFFTTCHLLPSSPFIKVTSKITISTILIFIHDAYFPIFKKKCQQIYNPIQTATSYSSNQVSQSQSYPLSCLFDKLLELIVFFHIEDMPYYSLFKFKKYCHLIIFLLQN